MSLSYIAKPLSRGIPPILAVPENGVWQMTYYFIPAVIYKSVGILLWFDNAPVTLMITIYHVTGANSVVVKSRDRPGPKCTNHHQALLGFADEYDKDFHSPAVIVDHNFHMGGVNTADQYRS